MVRAERGRWGARRAPAADDIGWTGDADAPHEPTALHAQRLQAVCDALQRGGARDIADLGCGDGSLVRLLLAQAQVRRIVGVDLSLPALGRLERTLPEETRPGGRLVLVHGGFTDWHPPLAGVDAVAMLETIEHLAPARLSSLEQLIFGRLSPHTVVVTTPNQEYNVLYGMAPGQMREPGHHFEWGRARFRQWAEGVAQRRGCSLRLAGIGAADGVHGSPSQMAVFTRP